MASCSYHRNDEPARTLHVVPPRVAPEKPGFGRREERPWLSQQGPGVPVTDYAASRARVLHCTVDTGIYSGSETLGVLDLSQFYAPDVHEASFLER